MTEQSEHVVHIAVPVDLLRALIDLARIAALYAGGPVDLAIEEAEALLPEGAAE